MTCPTCLRPQATEDDERTWQAVGRDEIERPDDWKDDDADHLCWKTHGGECEPPEWFSAVTPLEVQELRTYAPILRAQLTEERRKASDAIEAAAIAETMIAALDGEPISEFMSSFGPVQRILDLQEMCKLLQGDVEAQRRVIVNACAHLRVTDDDEADWPKLAMSCASIVEERDRLRAQLADAERHRDTLAQRLEVLTCGEPDPLIMTTATTIARLRMENAALTKRCEQQAFNAQGTALVLAAQEEEIAQQRDQIASMQQTIHGNTAALGIIVGEAQRKIDRLTPTWRDGTPPAGMCWREGEEFPVTVEIESGEAAGVYYYPANHDIGDEWGTARWCPIVKPQEAP